MHLIIGHVQFMLGAPTDYKLTVDYLGGFSEMTDDDPCHHHTLRSCCCLRDAALESCVDAPAWG